MYKKILILFLLLFLIGNVFATDITAPITTFDSNQISGTTDQNITLTCTDSNSGCKIIYYKIDNNEWTYPFTYTNDSNIDATIHTYNIVGQTTPVLRKTYLLDSSTKNAITKVRATVTKASYTACLMFRYNYEDSTHEDSAPLCTASTATENFNFPTTNKTILNVGAYLYCSGGCDSTPDNASFQDVNISYKNETYTVPTYNFVYSGVGDHNIQYFSTNNLDNNEETNTSYFTTYGNSTFNFYDESTELVLNDITWSVSPALDGNTGSTLTGTNQLDINLGGITSTNYTFTFTLTDYGTRYYQIDLNQFSDLNIGFALNPDTNSIDIPLKVYQTDETTIFSNTYVELYLPSKGNLIVGRLKTDASGETSFNLSTIDQNYYANVNMGEYTYQPVALTVLYPKNEETLAQITEDWKIDITQNLYISYSDLNTSKVIYLLPNTANAYNIKISDMNGNYFSRTYAQIYPGNPLTASLQPYLVSISTGLLTTITVLDASTGTAINNVTIKIYKYISGLGRTLVEQVVSDSKGQALSLLVLNGEYEFETYIDGVLTNIFDISATSNTIYIYLEQSGTIPSLNTGLFTANWTPSNLVQSTGTETFTSTLNNVYSRNITVYAYLLQNGVNLSPVQNWTGTDATHTFTFNPSWTDMNNTITSKLIVHDSDGNIYVLEKNYDITTMFGSNVNLLQIFQYGLRSDLGCTATGVCMPLLVIAVLMAIGLGLYVSSLMGSIGSQSVSVVFGLIMALFTFLNWVPIELMGVVAIIILAFLVNERR